MRVRLDRALSKLGVASRSDARRQIQAGLVQVNGRVRTDPAALVVPERARITIAGERARVAPWRTIAFHKPRGVLTTRRDPQGRPTVFDTLDTDTTGLVAVGRLDLASTGLLLLTTDTRLAAWLTDPESRIVRRYVVTVRGSVSDEAAAMLKHGRDGMRAETVTIRKRSRRETHLMIELTEGKNREIRRLLDGVGHDVTRLLRVSFGGIELGPLQPGTWRELTWSDVDSAFPHAPLSRSRLDRQ